MANSVNTPEISVIIPCYNVEKYLKKCIDSILNQTIQDIELIIVNDGSPDSSGQIADQMAKEDGRISVIHKENGGLSSARNAGIEVAKGEYISFIDSDDWIEPTFLEDMLRIATSIDAEIAVCGITTEFLKEGRVVVHKVDTPIVNSSSSDFGKLFWSLHESNLSNFAWNKLYKRSFIIENNLRFELDGMPAEDLFFNLQAFKLAKAIAVVDNAAYHYIRQEEMTILSSYQRNICDIEIRSREAYVDFFEHFKMGKQRFIQSSKLMSAAGQTANLFKRNAPFNLSLRIIWVTDHIFNKREELLESATSIEQWSLLDRLFAILLRINSPMFMIIVYTIVFTCRYRFAPLYLRIRHRLI